MQMSMGARIKEFRKRARMTQGDIADALGISRQAVSLWEHGVQEPTTSKMEAIAKILGVRVEDLVGVTIYPDMPAYERQRALNKLRSDTEFIVPVMPASLKRTEGGIWGTVPENSKLREIPVTISRFKGKPIAVISPKVRLKNLEIPGGSTVLVDAGCEIRPGGLSLIMMYGAPVFAQVYRAGDDDFIIEQENGRERLDAAAQADRNFDIVGPVVEIRTYL